MVGCAVPAQVAAAEPLVLANTALTAAFGDRGLVQLTASSLGPPYRFESDDFSVTVGDQIIDSRQLPPPERIGDGGHVAYRWTAGARRVEVVYEIRDDWLFVSKQVFVHLAPGDTVRVNEVVVLREKLAETPTEVYAPGSGRRDLGAGDYGGALRFRDGRGLLATVQNPFLRLESEGPSFSLRYEPAMDWHEEYGAYTSDRGLLSPYRLTNRRLPPAMLAEWKVPPLGDAASASAGMDEAEVSAFTSLVRSFLLDRKEKPLNVFVGWCVNDYQIDVATSEGRTEYKRLFDRAREMGADYVLYAPSNSSLSRREESADEWSWEHVLWLGLGQKIRKGEWNPVSSDVPAGVSEMIDDARSKDLKLLAYVYPVVPFSQNPSWLTTRPGNAGRQYATLASRALQDWLIENLVAFYTRTGIGGYAFDHTFLNLDGVSSYAQWAGWRRVMEELRRRIPDIAIDGRQAYHLYGPWGWLAGSYPHPTAEDEQPESFVPFPDLHFDRVSAARERYTAYRYRNYEFAPSEIVPGFMTHQTSRSDDSGAMPEIATTDRGRVLTGFRARDWDYLGWRYSVLSSIAVGGWNNVINMIPARDLDEFRKLHGRDKAWFRGWLAWCEKNKEFLRHTRTIIGPPSLGKIDGTSMIVGDRGYLFLFNPNAKRVTAEFTLDQTIGLIAGGHVLLREIYPLEGRSIGKPRTPDSGTLAIACRFRSTAPPLSFWTWRPRQTSMASRCSTRRARDSVTATCCN